MKQMKNSRQRHWERIRPRYNKNIAGGERRRRKPRKKKVKSSNKELETLPER